MATRNKPKYPILINIEKLNVHFSLFGDMNDTIKAITTTVVVYCGFTLFGSYIGIVDITPNDLWTHATTIITIALNHVSGNNA